MFWLNTSTNVSNWVSTCCQSNSITFKTGLEQSSTISSFSSSLSLSLPLSLPSFHTSISYIYVCVCVCERQHKFCSSSRREIPIAILFQRGTKLENCVVHTPTTKTYSPSEGELCHIANATKEDSQLLGKRTLAPLSWGQ